MTEEEQQFNQWFDEYADGVKVFEEADMKQAYLQGRAELKKENAELKSIAEFQQSSNMSRHFENKKLKEGLVVGSMWNKHLNSQNKALEEERDKYRDMTFDQREQLTKAKEIIKDFLLMAKVEHLKDRYETVDEAEQFLNSEVEK